MHCPAAKRKTIYFFLLFDNVSDKDSRRQSLKMSIFVVNAIFRAWKCSAFIQSVSLPLDISQIGP